MSHEFAAKLSLSRHNHNRDSGSRATEGHLERVWSNSNTRIVLVRGNASVGRITSEDAGESPSMSLVLFTTDQVEELGIEPVATVYLGRSETHDHSYVAVIVDAEREIEVESGTQWFDLRRWGHAMTDLDTGLFTQALALANWHTSHTFSPGSGEATIPTSSGWVRSTPSNQQVFPRTDVAVIVLVTDADDRVLLGNNALWEPNRFSLLAGFVDPGESLEAAAAREVFEESGFRVGHPEYLGSQPWPFPASLMVGFHARLEPLEDPKRMRPDGDEIRSLRWFSRDDIRNLGSEVILPGRTSIARSLLEHWYGETIDQDDVWMGVR